MTARDGHVHLSVVSAKPAWDWARWLVVALGVGGATLFVLALFQRWWGIWLYAPQYPGGLRIEIALTGMSGDVKEIDLLNHYIGMGHLEDAAPLERRLAAYGVAAIVAVSIALILATGKRLNGLVAVPALAFPVVFLADSFYWMYSFGHDLNPRAPLKIGTFTPQLFGNGKIGQFETYAEPQLGFWLAVAGVALIVLAAVVRWRVCAHCGRASTCGLVCPKLMVLPEHEARRA